MLYKIKYRVFTLFCNLTFHPSTLLSLIKEENFVNSFAVQFIHTVSTTKFSLSADCSVYKNCVWKYILIYLWTHKKIYCILLLYPNNNIFHTSFYIYFFLYNSLNHQTNAYRQKQLKTFHWYFKVHVKYKILSNLLMRVDFSPMFPLWIYTIWT